MSAPNDPYKEAPPPYSPHSAPPAGWAPPPQQQQWAPQQQYAQQPTVVTVQPMPTTQIIVVGGCPKCRVGVLEDSFTCCGIFCCILFFPIGLICLFTMKDKRCTNCGA